MNPYDKAHELARAVQALPQYQELRDLRRRIEGDPATLRMLQDFRGRQMELQAKQWMGQEIPAAEAETLRKLAEVVSLNRDVSQYLELEGYLERVLSDVQEILMKTLADAMLPLEPAKTGGDAQ
ncbi:MAG: YlbF family regulator [Alicyclobacillus sp.]|nr:YlbF family regulator [Alicyclobacillus sp.]